MGLKSDQSSERSSKLLFDPLQNFERKVPYRAFCGYNKRIQYFLPKREAIKFPYVQVNYPSIDYLCYDLDYPAAAFRFEVLDVPRPTLIVITKPSGHAHALYELLYPLPHKQSQQTKHVLEDIIHGYKELLCADRCITSQKQLIKNALSDAWDVVRGYAPFTLSELVQYIPDDLRTKRNYEPEARKALTVKSFEETLVPHSRNCSLFQNARFYAYSIAREHSNYVNLYNSVMDFLEHLNDFQILLYFPKKVAKSELCSIARSISKWTFERRYQFKTINVGAMGFDSMKGVCWDPEEYNQEVARRRKLSAHRTHQLRKETTRSRIEEGTKICLKRGIEPTAANISTLAGVSRPTLYNHSFRQIIESVKYALSGNYSEAALNRNTLSSMLFFDELDHQKR